MPKKENLLRTRKPLARRTQSPCAVVATENVFNSHSSRTRRSSAVPSALAGSQNEIAALIRRNVRRGDCVVELGCAEGDNLKHLAALVGPSGRVAAVDSSPDHIQRLRNQAWLKRETNISVFLSRGDSLPIEPSTVDAIFCQGIVSPSGPRHAVYREMLRVLRPGGLIVVHDIVVHNLLPPEIADSVAAFSSGLAGAIEAASYRHMLERLDLRDVILTHCPSPDLLSELLIPSAQNAFAHRTDSTLADLRNVLPDFISVVRIRAQKRGRLHH